MSTPPPEAIELGRRLMPSILSYESQKNPQRLFALSSKPNTIEDGFQRITFEQVGRAASYVSLWLKEHLGLKSAEDQESLAYLGVPDLRYNFVFYATLQLRKKVSEMPLC